MIKAKLQRAYTLLGEWKNHSLVRQYGANAVWLMIARFYWIATALTVGIYVARVLGPRDFGILNYAIAFVGMYAIIATLGVDGVIVRDLVARPGDRDRILGNFTVFRLVLLAAMAVALSGTLLASAQPSRVKWLCVIIGLGYSGYLLQPAQVYFVASVKSRYFAMGQIVACTLYSLIRLGAAYFRLPLYVYALAEATMFLSANGVQFYLYGRGVGSPLRWTFRLRDALALIVPAIPLSMCVILNVIYARTDILMIEHFMGAEYVGYYSIATRFTENWYLLGVLLAVNFFPAIVSASGISEAAYVKQLHRLYFMCFWLMTAAAGITILLGYYVIRLLYGESYLPAVAPLYLYVCTLPGSLILYVFGQWAVNENQLKTYAAVLGAGAFLNVVSNFFLIPRCGMMGAAFGSLAAMPLGMVAVLLWRKRWRLHLLLVLRSIFTLPSLKLGEHGNAEPND